MIRAREGMDWSQSDLSAATGVSVGTIQALERFDYSRGHGITLDKVDTLSEVLLISVEEIAPKELWGKEIPSHYIAIREVDSALLLAAVDLREQRLLQSSPAELASNTEFQQDLQTDLAAVLATLSYREREVIKMRYGIGDGYTYTLEEVGRIFEISKDRVRQIEAKAIRRLQGPFRMNRLRKHDPS